MGVDQRSFTPDGSSSPNGIDEGRVWNAGESWMPESYWRMSILFGESLALMDDLGVLASY